MKKFLLFITLVMFSININAQVEWTGGGDGYSWDDPFNWDIGDVPFDGEDIYINGANVDYQGSDETYGSLTLTNGANLLIENNMNLYGDFNVGPTSRVSIPIIGLNNYPKVIVGGNYFFEGDIDILFSTYAPQIGNSYLPIQGNLGICLTPTTDIVPEYQTSGFQAFLAVQCQSNGVLYTITDINYTTAISWDGEGGDGQWDNPANWDPNGIPTANDTVIINLPTGDTVYTNGAGTTSAYLILIGDNNNLVINGDFEMFSVIQSNVTATIDWRAGEISRTDTNVQSAIINYGSLSLNGPGLKEMGNGFQIWSYGGIQHNQGNLDINTGEITVYDSGYYINDDNITIGYSSGTQHSLRLINTSELVKTSGTGTSSINLTNFLTFFSTSVVSEEGTLSFGENLTNYGSLSGSGSFQLPNSHIEVGMISPGSSPGVLTVIGDFTTSNLATFNIEIDGPNAGTEYDQIIVTNEAILDGTINVTLGYLPDNEAIFEIVTAGTLTSCNFPAQITSNFGGTDYTFDVLCQNNKLYLNGPGATLSNSSFEASELQIYPNPVTDILSIKLSRSIDGNWLLFNQLGQLVLEGKLDATETTVNTNFLLSGFYALQIKDENNKTVTVKKIIKN